MIFSPNGLNLSRPCRVFDFIHEAARHCKDGHLKLIAEDAIDGVCPACEPPVVLEHTRHLMSHVLVVHGLKS